MGKPVTIEELRELGQTMVTIPGSKTVSGRDLTLRVRRIGRGEYLSFLPPLPAVAATWRAEEIGQREVEWLATLSPDELEARRAVMRDVAYRVVAAAVLEPRMSFEDARCLGTDAEQLAAEIGRFSGLLPTDGQSAPAAQASEEASASDAAA